MKLTNEQIERAAQSIWFAMQSYSVAGKVIFPTDSAVKNAFLQAIRDAAPILQMPWDMPSEEESHSARHFIASGNAFHCKIDEGGNQVDRVFAQGWHSALARFVFNRNIDLMPKPVDPRRDKIRKAIGSARLDMADDLVDRIIVALDSKE